jgi:hypothetical protein
MQFGQLKRREFIMLLGGAESSQLSPLGSEQIPTHAGCLREERTFPTSDEPV